MPPVMNEHTEAESRYNVAHKGAVAVRRGYMVYGKDGETYTAWVHSIA